VNVTFACPQCHTPARLGLSGARDWECPACAHRLPLEAPAPELSACAVCGNHELYKKKDFPHWLGLSILTFACVASVFTYGWYEKWLTWAILIGSAAFDGLLYLWVGDAIVCYRCNAHYRGFVSQVHHKPFELTVGERYRQERLRRDSLKSAAPPAP
jgi:hypothetical protein